MLQVDSNETNGENASWELRKNASCCFEQIQEAAPHKTAAIQPLNSHLLNHTNKQNKIYWEWMEK